MEFGIRNWELGWSQFIGDKDLDPVAHFLVNPLNSKHIFFSKYLHKSDSFIILTHQYFLRSTRSSPKDTLNHHSTETPQMTLSQVLCSQAEFVEAQNPKH